ncbi:hypothetical protein KAR91_73110 [Candidatus Pacearchaeota archaeon]|nr:hypothetical protein [Candidatus Pacearchaeota archaeon]
MICISSRFFCNTSCEYYLYHEDLSEINYLFCYCPLYGLKDCKGSFKYSNKFKIVPTVRNHTKPRITI